MTGYLHHLREQVEEYLETLVFAEDRAAAGLEEAMRYSLLAGGKRVRPVLALATAEALGAERPSVMPLAAAPELIHTYSLIHADLPAMDDGDLRRARPSCHSRFARGGATLSRDALELVLRQAVQILRTVDAVEDAGHDGLV